MRRKAGVMSVGYSQLFRWIPLGGSGFPEMGWGRGWRGLALWLSSDVSVGSASSSGLKFPLQTREQYPRPGVWGGGRGRNCVDVFLWQSLCPVGCYWPKPVVLGQAVNFVSSS